MAKRLTVPPELEHLIEKREGDEERRGKKRRSSERRDSDMGPLGAIETTGNLSDVPTSDRRGKQRRQSGERRRTRRRKSGG